MLLTDSASKHYQEKKLKTYYKGACDICLKIPEEVYNGRHSLQLVFYIGFYEQHIFQPELIDRPFWLKSKAPQI